MSFQSINKPTAKQSLVSISKSLSYVTRHGAKKENLEISNDGFIKVNDLLKHALFKNTTFEEIQTIVDTNDKKRFRLEKKSDGLYYICANQGHTLSEIEVELTPLLSIDQLNGMDVTHGGYKKDLQSIIDKGLLKMDRNHVHFGVGNPGSAEVISGMRASANMIIYIDIVKCLADKIPFFLSANNVALTEGPLPSAYFLKIIDRKTNVTIFRP